MVTRYLSVSEIAARLGYPPDTIARRVRRGKFPAPHVQIGKRARGWLPEVIDNPDTWSTPVDTVHYWRHEELAQWMRDQLDEYTRYRIPGPDIQVGDTLGWLPRSKAGPAWIKDGPLKHADLPNCITYLGVGDIADRLGRTRSAVNGWIAEGKFPHPNARIGPKVQGWLPELVDNRDSWATADHETIRYFSAPELAEMIGVKRFTINRYKLPPEDAVIGSVRGYLVETIGAWQQRRPGLRPPRDREDWHLPLEMRAS